MAQIKIPKEKVAIVLIEPQNDFLSEGGTMLQSPHTADAAVCIAASPSSFVRCPCPPISSANACARPPSDSAMLFKRLAV